MAGGQLSLFGEEPERPAPDRHAVAPADVAPHVRDVAAMVPGRIRLGTSSWSFPGWTGLVYAPSGRTGKPHTEATLAKAGLPAYAAHPLLRTVSLDRTFYAPLPADAFARYAAQVPDDFRFVVKAPAAFTDPFLRQHGSGQVGGDNPTFLDAAAAAAAFVQPAVAGLGPRCGPLVFQFPPLGRRLLADLPRTVARIAAFMTALARRGTPGPAPLAVEVRDPALCTAALAAALRDSGAVPCLAIHARMPPAAAQAATFGLDRDDSPWPVVARWNLHAGRGYEEARADYFPFDRLVEEDEPTRETLARLAARAAGRGRDVFVTINNKAEGSAPLSVARLAGAIAREIAVDQPVVARCEPPLG